VRLLRADLPLGTGRRRPLRVLHRRLGVVMRHRRRERRRRGLRRVHRRGQLLRRRRRLGLPKLRRRWRLGVLMLHRRRRRRRRQRRRRRRVHRRGPLLRRRRLGPPVVRPRRRGRRRGQLRARRRRWPLQRRLRVTRLLQCVGACFYRCCRLGSESAAGGHRPVRALLLLPVRPVALFRLLAPRKQLPVLRAQPWRHRLVGTGSRRC